MKGLIKKDLLLLKNNWKTLILFIFVYLICSTEQDGIESFIIPFMTAMICMSTFNYDEYNKWDAYALTLPGKKDEIIKAKYLTALILIVVGVLVSFALSGILGFARGNFVLDQTIEYTLAGLASGLLVISIMYPLIIKFGLEKGRLIIVGCSFGFSALLVIVAKSLPKNLFAGLALNFEILLPVLTVGIFIGSYLLARKFYLKKEF